MEEPVSQDAAEVLKGYIVVVSDGSAGPWGEVRGVLRSKKMKIGGERCWWLEGSVIHHLIPVQYIVEVRREDRRYVW